MTRFSPLALILFAALPAAHAQGLSLTIGNAVAGQQAMFKGAQFLFRVNGCADLSKANITATAEGVAGGVRSRMPLRLFPLQAPGAYAVTRQWGTGGRWLVAITVGCQNETAGATVPINGTGFVRENVRLLSHSPSPEEIDAALKGSEEAVPAAQ